MFYSPTKQFVRFSTYRTAQIKALKDRIQKEKVTQEQIETTQLRLDRLRKQYEQINQNKHTELKDVFHNSERAIAELLKEKNLSQKQDAFLKKQFEELQRHRIDLQQKGSITEEQLMKVMKEKDELVSKKVALQESLLELKSQEENVKEDAVKIEELKQQVSSVQNALDLQKEAYEFEKKKCHKKRQSLELKIKAQKEALNTLKLKWEHSEKEKQHQQMQINRNQLSQELCYQKMAAFSLTKTTANDEDWMLEEQKKLFATLESALQAVKKELSQFKIDSQNCEVQTKEVSQKVKEQQQIKAKLEERAAVARANLKLLRQKNTTLRFKMNSIFRNDNQLVSIICSKKVYPNVKEEVCEIVKKSAVKPLQSKQNVSMPMKKANQEVSTPRAFAEVNRLV